MQSLSGGQFSALISRIWKPKYRLLLCVAGAMSLRLNDILQYSRLKSRKFIDPSRFKDLIIPYAKHVQKSYRLNRYGMKDSCKNSHWSLDMELRDKNYGLKFIETLFSKWKVISYHYCNKIGSEISFCTKCSGMET